MKFYALRKPKGTSGKIYDALPGRRYTEPAGDDGNPVGQKANRTVHNIYYQDGGRLYEAERMFFQTGRTLVPALQAGIKPTFAPVYEQKDFCMALLDDNPSKDGVNDSSALATNDKRQVEIYSGSSSSRQFWNFSDYYGETISGNHWDFSSAFFCDEWGVYFDIPSGGTVEKIIWAPYCTFYGIRGRGLSGTKIISYKALRGVIKDTFADPAPATYTQSDGSITICNDIDTTVSRRYKFAANVFVNAPGNYALRYVRDAAEYQGLKDIVHYQDGSLEEMWRQARNWLIGDYA